MGVRFHPFSEEGGEGKSRFGCAILWEHMLEPSGVRSISEFLRISVFVVFFPPSVTWEKSPRGREGAGQEGGPAGG